MRSLRMLLASAALLLATCAGPATDEDTAASRSDDAIGAQAGGSVVVDAERMIAFAADADNGAIHALDLIGASITSTDVGGRPEQVVRLDRDHLAVTLRGENRVARYAIDAAGALTLECAADVASDPFGLALTPAGLLLVTSAFGRRVTALDAATLSVRWSIPVAREPRGVAVTPDGARAFVSHLVGDALSVIDLRAETPHAVSFAALDGAHRDRLDRATAAGTRHPTPALGYAVAISPSGARAFVPHLIEQNGATIVRVVPSAYGGVPIEDDSSSASVAVIAAAGPPARLDAAPSAQLPVLAATAHLGMQMSTAGSRVRQARAAAVTGTRLLVASQGTNELVELDARAIDPAIAPVRRFSVGEGPKGVAVESVTDVAVVWNQLSHDFALVDLGAGSVERIQAASDPLPPEIAAGRRLFTTERDRRISRDGRACAACHPEGRDDGVVWHLGAGPRQTPTLVGRTKRGPFGWLGKHARLEDNVSETIGRLGGSGLPAAELAALGAFLREGLIAPTRVAAPEDHRVARGRTLFESQKVGCSGCHQLGTEASDRAVHDVASRAKNDASGAFRTPPLLFVGDTAPYFHDGRYATLEQLLRDDLDRMGETTHLSDAELDALAAYLRTL